MKCADVERALAADPETWSASMEEHVSACAACSERFAEQLWGSAAPQDDSELTNGLLADLETRVAKETGPLAWLRERSTRTRVFVIGGATLALSLGMGARKLRPDLNEYPTVQFATVGLLFVALAVAALAFRVRPLYRPRASTAVVAVIASVAAFAFLILPLAFPVTASEAAVLLAKTNVLGHALSCCAFGSLIAALPLAAILVTDRHPPTATSALFAAFFGAAAGNLALHLHCPLVDTEHLLLGHGSIVLVLLALLSVWGQMTRRTAR